MMKVFVTGAAGGIGQEIVRELLKYGQYKVIAVSRDQNRMLDAIEQDKNLFIEELDFNDNIPDPQLKKIFEKYGSIDVLINNAGSLIKKPFDQFSDRDVLSVFNINIISVIKLIRVLLPQLMENAGCRVINISSMAGVQKAPKYTGLSVYSAAKSALCTLTESLDQEYGGKGLIFNCLALGSVETTMFHKAFPGKKAATSSREMARYIVNFALNQSHLFSGKIVEVAAKAP